MTSPPIAPLGIALALLRDRRRRRSRKRSPRRSPRATRMTGRTIADRDCVGCHAQLFSGDADQMYRRSDRRVKTPAQLLAQVQACNVNLGKGYFPEEEEHIAAYLNLEFYKFAP